MLCWFGFFLKDTAVLIYIYSLNWKETLHVRLIFNIVVVPALNGFFGFAMVQMGDGRERWYVLLFSDEWDDGVAASLYTIVLYA